MHTILSMKMYAGSLVDSAQIDADTSAKTNAYQWKMNAYVG